MLNCLWYKSTKTIFIFAIVCSLFITIDFFLKQPSLTPEWIVILNRIICIVTIWLLSVVIYIAHRNKHATEKKIMDSEILASIVKASNDGIISKSIDGTIISWNKGAQNIFGYTAEEMIGNNIRLLIPEDRIEEENIIINKIKQGEIIYNYETVRIKKGNIPIYVSLTISPIYDANGNFVSISKIARDITQNIAREEKFRLIVKWSPYSIIMVDGNSMISLVNAHAEKMFGYSEQELLNHSIECLIPKKFRTAHSKHVQHYLEDPNLLQSGIRDMAGGRELLALHKNSKEIPVTISLIPVTTEEGLMIIVTLVDITEQKKIEEERKKINITLEETVKKRTAELTQVNKEMEEFVYAASHDLKAPLRVISNAAKWLAQDLEEFLTDDTRESLGMLLNRVSRMEKLLDDLLEYSRVGRKIDDRYSELVFASELLDNISEMLGPPKNFNITVSPKLQKFVVYRMPLQQILFNLIGNAIKHHDKKMGSIEIDADDCGDFIRFYVKDDGPGIPKQFQESIFEMFQTLKPRDQVEGSGMGLAIVRKHIERLGGEIHIESEEGKGSVFIFTILKPNGKTGC